MEESGNELIALSNTKAPTRQYGLTGMCLSHIAVLSCQGPRHLSLCHAIYGYRHSVSFPI